MRNPFGLLLGLVLLLSLFGCGDGQSRIPVSDRSVSPPAAETQTQPLNPRFKIESYGSFDAGYSNNKREILIVTDTVTGKSYLGITGVGVTELVKRGKSQAEE